MQERESRAVCRIALVCETCAMASIRKTSEKMAFALNIFHQENACLYAANRMRRLCLFAELAWKDDRR